MTRISEKEYVERRRASLLSVFERDQALKYVHFRGCYREGMTTKVGGESRFRDIDNRRWRRLLVAPRLLVTFASDGALLRFSSGRGSDSLTMRRSRTTKQISLDVLNPA